jgi:predicted DNA binding CopG/RHH family protein
METSRLPHRIIQRLRKEALVWDRAMARESEARVTAQIEKAEVFKLSRPARERVSVRLDPQDIRLLKRLARRRGIPHSELIAQWVHERIERETRRRVS